MHIFLFTQSPYFMCQCTEYKLLALQVWLSEENTPNATVLQFVTAKISGGALKQGSTTHSSIRQSNLQWKNEAALMSCRIRAVEHRVSGDGLAGAHPGSKIESCWTTQELRMRIKHARKLSILLLFMEVQQTLVCLFSFWDTINAWMLLC